MSPGLLVSWSQQGSLFGLILVLLIAALFRFYGLGWDSGYLFHPDERKILLVAASLRVPASIVDFFSADSPLNPKFFAYGSFPIYLLRVLGALAPATSFTVPWREDIVSLALLGRVLSVLFDLGTIALTFFLGRRLYAARVGLIAAACIAVSVLHIQLAHFYAVDTLVTFLVVATMYCTLRFAQTGARRDAVLVGITFGLALATKVTALPLIVPIVVAVAKAKADTETRRQGDRGTVFPLVSLSLRLRVLNAMRGWCDPVWAARRTLAKILGVAFVVFVVTQPYALLDPIQYSGQVGTEWLIARGWLDYPYTRQYAGTLPFVYQIWQSSVWGLGAPLGIFAWGGAALFTWRWWKTRQWNDSFVLSWAFVYFLTIGAQQTKYLRYLLPLAPFLFLMAGAWLTSRTSHFMYYASRITLGIALLSAFVYSLMFISIYSREHPWLAVSQWIYANIPAKSAIAVEHWDDVLPVPMRLADASRAPTDFEIKVLPMYDADDAIKVQTLVDTLSSSDYVVLATQRLSATIPRLPQRYPISSRYYHLLFGGQLGFDLVDFARNDMTLNGIKIVDDRFVAGVTLDGVEPRDAVVWNWGRADESFTVYDHPLPLIFKKTRALSSDALRTLLTSP